MQRNGECDETCNNQECEYDRGDCAEFIYVNAAVPEDKGIGTVGDPYRSIDRARHHTFATKIAGVFFLNLTRSDPKAISFTSSLSQIFITCPPNLSETSDQPDFAAGYSTESRDGFRGKDLSVDTEALQAETDQIIQASSPPVSKEKFRDWKLGNILSERIPLNFPPEVIRAAKSAYEEKEKAKAKARAEATKGKAMLPNQTMMSILAKEDFPNFLLL
jgi:hypothetical protein